MLRRPLAIALSLATLASCQVVPETGRSQLLFFNEKQMNEMAMKAYAEETGKYPVVTGTAEARMVQEVGERIAKACGRNFAWEFKLLDAPKVINAFALPGGKIAVYSGLLKVTQTADGLATVMGHEVAHATSNHGNERMSSASLAKFGSSAVAMVLQGWSSGSDETKQMVGQVFGLVGAGTVQKFSRDHESEADAIGLEFMMKAGYNPDAAPALWERMAALSADKEQPGFIESFFATHPPSKERAEALRALIPKLRQKLGMPGKGVQKDALKPKK